MAVLSWEASDGSGGEENVDWVVPRGSPAVIEEGEVRLKHLGSEAHGTYTASNGELTARYELGEQREAVVVVHGIGEQRRLVHGRTWTDSLLRPQDMVYEQPRPVPGVDGQVTRQFRITWAPIRVNEADGPGDLRTGNVVKTDVYEHYWQPSVRDTKWSHFLGFVRSRILSAQAVPARLELMLVAGLSMLLPLLTAVIVTRGSKLPVLAGLGALQVAAAAMLEPPGTSGILAIRARAVGTVGAATVVGVIGAIGLAALSGGSSLVSPLSLSMLILSLVLLTVGLGEPTRRPLRWSSASEWWRGWFLVGAVTVFAIAAVGANSAPTWVSPQDWPWMSRIVLAGMLLSVLSLAAIIRIPHRRKLWMVGLLLGVGWQVAAIAWALPESSSASPGRDWLRGLIVTVVAGLVGGWVVRHAGDFLRYLDPSPDNEAVRNDLAHSGSELLRYLHETGDYSRVVVIAHSLGSLVAYDSLVRYWHDVHDSLEGVTLTDVQAVENAAEALVPWIGTQFEPPGPVQEGTESAANLDVYQAAQGDLWRSVAVASDQPGWLISDFVTLGSPLAHADFLYDDFPAAVARRRLVSCPPIRQHFRTDFTFRSDVLGLHHAAPFAITRWTNLTYLHDVVGGSVSAAMGPGVRDEWLDEPSRLKSLFPVNHTSYPADPQVGARLRGILDPSLNATPTTWEARSRASWGALRGVLERFDLAADEWAAGDEPPELTDDVRRRVPLLARIDPAFARFRVGPTQQVTLDEITLVPEWVPMEGTGAMDDDPGGSVEA